MSPAAMLSCSELAVKPSESLVGNKQVVPETIVSSIATAQAATDSCGGNLDTQQVLCDSVRTRFKSENKRNLDFAALGIDPASYPGLTPGNP